MQHPRRDQQLIRAWLRAEEAYLSRETRRNFHIDAALNGFLANAPPPREAAADPWCVFDAMYYDKFRAGVSAPPPAGE